ncbi:hypothetical protein NX722_27810 [Endozoicomonas gorgoniicola]|uniref:Uncharacterized protein n=1 Tax=Endozoicomonas gorgoniicola TaxID=1234144 RepID=A0ABT3N413_9GAMM|nr:hypothetical protein [Endozoicomonas gorgoniicola]MCW7556372.1 hypothetical protein [Endozoicomonas gorgoniicola]
MKRRIHSRKIKPLKLELPSEISSKKLTFIAYGNIVNVEKKAMLWCLFCDEDKKLHESLQPLSIMPYFTLGRCFNNSFLINSTTAPTFYHASVSKDKTSLTELPRRLLQTDFTQFQGQYHKQYCVKVRNKSIQLVDVMLRTFCPDPEFGKVALTLLSKSFIFKNVRQDNNHLYIELDGVFSFRITTAVARQLALMATCEEYRHWHTGIAFSAGEALTCDEGMPWRCKLPDFPLKVTYSPLDSSGVSPFYRVASVRPQLALPGKVTVYLKDKSEVFSIR